MKTKLQAATSKLQRSSKNQAPNGASGKGLELEVWNFSGAWSLELGAFRRAFTLIELLVVISIIAVLAAIALPALKTFRPNPSAIASRAIMDAVSRTRQLAISQRTTVFLVFVPTNFWNDGTYRALPVAEQNKGIPLYEKQLIGYNFVSLRSAGDQPGQHFPRYLSSWKTLPEGAFIPLQKFSPAYYPNTPNTYVVTNPPGRNAFPIYGFHTNNNIPFPTEATPPVNGHWATLPFVAFNYLGQLVDASNKVTQVNEYIPIAKGNVIFARDVNKVPAQQSPTLAETPAVNAWAGNSYNLINIDWLTGRARVEHMEVQ